MSQYPKTIYSNSTEETEAYGIVLAKEIESNASLPKFIALYGDLGVG